MQLSPFFGIIPYSFYFTIFDIRIKLFFSIYPVQTHRKFPRFLRGIFGEITQISAVVCEIFTFLSR